MPAKLLSPILFCNDINLRTLLNIVIYDENHLLITCKSFIKRFNIEDRKQVNSWITRSWHPFTCGAVKDPKSQSLYAVINNSSLAHWSINEKDIEAVKRHSFTSWIHSLVTTSKSVYIVYTGGYIEMLQSALKLRKDEKCKVIKEGEIILDSRVFEKQEFAVVLVKNKANKHFLYRFKVGSTKNILSIPIYLDTCDLTGSSLFSCGSLITAWSSGHLYRLNVTGKKLSVGPGKLQGKLQLLKPTKKMRILEFSSDYFALQGMNVNEEGGILALWDSKFGVSVCSKPLKMYRNPPLAWGVCSGAVVGEGGYLVYIPAELSPSTVASMLGSRISGKVITADECFAWNVTDGERNVKDISTMTAKTTFSNKSIELADIVQKINCGSLSENIVANLLVNHLLQEKNIKLIKECLSAFKFVPEKCLVEILQFYINLPDEDLEKEKRLSTTSRIGVRKNTKTPAKEKKSKKGKQTNAKERDENNAQESIVNGLEVSLSIGADDKEKSVICPFSSSKSELINEVLSQSFTAKELSHHIRLLNFKSSLILLEYLHYILASGMALVQKSKDSTYPTIEKTSLWMSFILDANYHQFVMTSELDVQRHLLTCFNDVFSMLNFLDASHTIEILIERVLSSNPMPKTQNDLPYSIEKMVL